MKIVFIGSGNLATHLSMALQNAGEEIIQIYSRTFCNANILAEKLHCEATNSIDEVFPNADVYIFSIKDDALASVATKLCHRNPKSLFLHTAGSVPMALFEGKAQHYGVLYPMQTFSKEREVDFKEIPCFIEASDKESLATIHRLAESISENVIETSSETRRKLHLAAVFACNMTNHCYRLAERVLEEDNIDFRLFLPLIKETANKVTYLSPREAQTGPMVRNDKSIIDSQLCLITDKRTQDIYRLFAESIYEDCKRSK